MISYHIGKLGGHNHSGSGDIVFLLIEEHNSTCSVKCSIIVYF